MNNQFASIEIAKNKTIQPKTSQVDHRVKIALDAIFYSAVAYLFSCIWFDLLAKAVFLNYPLTYAWLPKLIITLLVLLIVNCPRIFGYGFLGLSSITILFGCFSILYDGAILLLNSSYFSWSNIIIYISY